MKTTPTPTQDDIQLAALRMLSNHEPIAKALLLDKLVADLRIGKTTARKYVDLLIRDEFVLTVEDRPIVLQVTPKGVGYFFSLAQKGMSPEEREAQAKLQKGGRGPARLPPRREDRDRAEAGGEGGSLPHRLDGSPEGLRGDSSDDRINEEEDGDDEEWVRFDDEAELLAWILSTDGGKTTKGFQEQVGIADFRELIGVSFQVVHGRLFIRPEEETPELPKTKAAVEEAVDEEGGTSGPLVGIPSPGDPFGITNIVPQDTDLSPIAPQRILDHIEKNGQLNEVLRREGMSRKQLTRVLSGNLGWAEQIIYYVTQTLLQRGDLVTRKGSGKIGLPPVHQNPVDLPQESHENQTNINPPNKEDQDVAKTKKTETKKDKGKTVAKEEEKRLATATKRGASPSDPAECCPTCGRKLAKKGGGSGARKNGESKCGTFRKWLEEHDWRKKLSRQDLYTMWEEKFGKETLSLLKTYIQMSKSPGARTGVHIEVDGDEIKLVKAK